MKKYRLSLATKLTTIFVIIFLALMFIAGYTWHLIKVSPYFQIKDIIPRDGPRVDALSYLKGKNIFSIDLRRESIYISQFFPEYRSVRLFRILPNRLFVDFIKRAPVAVVKLYRYFNLDEEGVLFHQSQQGVPGLPQITGLETKIFGPQPGKKYNIKELSLGLNIIKEIDKNRRLKNYTIKKINIDNPTNATIFMPLPNLNAVLEVRLGAENIKDKVAILSSIILAAKNELANIKYIDLRFKEPVIKMRDAQ